MKQLTSFTSSHLLSGQWYISRLAYVKTPRCTTHPCHSPGAYYCRKPTELYASTVERVVWDKVSQSFADPPAPVEILKARNAAATEKGQVTRAELDMAMDQLGKKHLELQQVLTWARQKFLTADELKPQVAQVREQRQHWEREVEKLNQKLGSLQAGDRNLADAERLCLSIRDRLVGLTAQEKKEFLRLVVERIWVDKSNNLEIEVIIPSFEKHPTGVICESPLSWKAGGRKKEGGKAPLLKLLPASPWGRGSGVR